MRIFTYFKEAFPELKRELSEMGTDIAPQTVQDKIVANNPDYATKELQNYVYTVTNPDPSHLTPFQPWADAEWEERKAGIEGKPVNPGQAWKMRQEAQGDLITWSDYLEVDGIPAHGEKGKMRAAELADSGRAAFAYSYGDRFDIGSQVLEIIQRLKEDNQSRQLYISLWDPHVDPQRLGYRRVPCSLGWHLMYRGGKLNITYFMRSCEFATHFQNDIYLTLKLQRYIAEKSGLEPGMFVHWISSFHIYARHLKNVF